VHAVMQATELVGVLAVSADVDPYLFADVLGRPEIREAGAVVAGGFVGLKRRMGPMAPCSVGIAAQNGSSSSGMITRLAGVDRHRWRAASWMSVR
jgi:hypothetical protein